MTARTHNTQREETGLKIVTISADKQRVRLLVRGEGDQRDQVHCPGQPAGAEASYRPVSGYIPTVQCAACCRRPSTTCTTRWRPTGGPCTWCTTTPGTYISIYTISTQYLHNIYTISTQASPGLLGTALTAGVDPGLLEVALTQARPGATPCTVFSVTPCMCRHPGHRPDRG